MPIHVVVREQSNADLFRPQTPKIARGLWRPTASRPGSFSTTELTPCSRCLHKIMLNLNSSYIAIR